MKYNRDFYYNQDFEWYETEVLVGREWISLFVPCYIELDLLLLQQTFARIVSWIMKNRTLVDTLCFKKLSAHLSWQEKSTCWEKNELILLSLSIEKEDAFELLLECKAYEKYVILLFDRRYELLDCRIDF